MTIAVAAPTTAELVTAARSIADALAAQAPDAERARQLPSTSVKVMADAGMWRILTPRTYGGSEAGLRAQVETLLVIAAADPAAGWVQMVSNAHCWMVGNFPVACQDEVFAAGPDVRVPGTLAAQGKAVRLDDGWRLNGRWQFASGVDTGDWLLIGAIADTQPDSTDRALHVVVPKVHVTVDDTWFTLGLRGTGSKDVVAEDVFVPRHRSMPTRALFDGLSPHGERHATHINRLPVLVCLSVQLAAAVTGIATSALDLYVERTRTRREVYTGRPKAENVGTQLRVAESQTELDVATMLLREAADRCDLVAASGDRLTIDERAVLKWRAAYIVELCRRATDRVFAGAGAHGIYDDSVLQGRYRDVNTACHHAVVDFDSSAEMFGRTRLGLDPGTPIV
jgi:3-hydroxy-9,10-secoandrosta-1,3,5(10)-triene-9,17-dione monooxygenase